MRRLLPVLAVMALALPPTAFAIVSATTTLTGTTGPGFTITLKKGGKVVKTLRPGTYKLTVSDKSSMHDFVLTGPGIRNLRITGLASTGTRSKTVRLRRGIYTYYCTPHRSHGMKGTFRVR
ncbi:MAG TPA: plastocyanin/azurin family copper-binding protein [Gaiellaceae bacterium]|nr:plastocyanin/azurin family copper-binding protein [Gaiellaceae bacterium]